MRCQHIKKWISLSFAPLIIPPTYLALGMLFMLGSLTSRELVRSGLGFSEWRTRRDLGFEGAEESSRSE
ncbi:hypothetical protein BO99DRAFT_399701 [Aspergillus violaceofuscus CBS 115571]|uniref:Uncharacterized protein n=1 Tax=Aspergillus violaceofuscus (strain CBS 115571) TaxID=1450538 RepID=A0A2V5I3B1_ASPV1|nr:hypothetical protein BO99DRAFT_399701 [Aspergillus violaceofuscus CBS 115571]